MKIFRRVLLGVGITVLVLGAIVGSTYLYFKNVQGIDAVKVIKSFKALNKVDESYTNKKFTNEDLTSAVNKINSSTPNLLVKDGDYYKVNDNYTTLPVMLKDISLNGKETTALFSNFKEKEGKESLKDLNLIDISYSNLENDSINLTTVISYNFTSSQKDTLNNFPMILFKGLLPDTIYVKSVIKVSKTTTAFEYNTSSVELCLNSLNNEDAKYTFDLLNRFMNFGTSDEINLKIGDVVANALIGNSDNEGFGYIYSKLGAKDFKFKEENGELVYSLYK